jgi:hypothetical protein
MASKIIVKTMGTDKRLKLIQEFRRANEKCGFFRKVQAESSLSNVQLQEWEHCGLKLHELAKKAEELGFFIWVNHEPQAPQGTQGKTGHTYSKDYRKTPANFHFIKNNPAFDQKSRRIASIPVKGW